MDSDFSIDTREVSGDVGLANLFGQRSSASYHAESCKVLGFEFLLMLESILSIALQFDFLEVTGSVITAPKFFGLPRSGHITWCHTTRHSAD
jgi:hypothetical protein